MEEVDGQVGVVEEDLEIVMVPPLHHLLEAMSIVMEVAVVGVGMEEVMETVLEE